MRTRIEEIASPELINKIKQLWETGLSKEAIAEELGLDSTYLLNQIRDKHSLRHRSGSRNGEVFLEWTEQEDLFVVEKYRKIGAKKTADALIRTVGAVHARAADLMVSSKKVEWTEQEDKALLELRAEQLPFSSIAGHLQGRTMGACAARYKYLIKGKSGDSDS